MINSTIALVILCVSSAISAVTFGLLINSAIQLKKKHRTHFRTKINGLTAIFAATLVCLAAGLCITQAPHVIPQAQLEAIAPGLWNAMACSLECMVVLGCAWFLFDFLFPNHKETSYMSLVILGILSGFGNFLIISIINAGINNVKGDALPLAVYYVFGIATYLSCQKLLRTRFVYLTNSIVHIKRTRLTEKILHTSYQTFEKIDSGEIYAGLNNDTEAVSEAANLIILAATASITIVFCFIYLAIISIWGLLVSLGVILSAMMLYLVAGQKARRIWSKTRDMQNTFFKFISDMVGGFKELAVDEKKKAEFMEDMFDKCTQYKYKKIEASVKFTNVFVLGEFMFTFTIGVVAFLFSILFRDMDASTIRSFVLIFLYMSSPVYTLLNTIPNLIQVKISWDRIIELEKRFSALSSPRPFPAVSNKTSDSYSQDMLDDKNHKETSSQAHTEETGAFLLELKNVLYTYKEDITGAFCVGPLSCHFTSGEITFITGGNGSGKSTMAKLMTGLYPPDGGKILVGGKVTASDQLGRNFSVIFSDSFIFDRLYGINCSGKEEFIHEQLRVLRLDDKLVVENGAFNHTNLSTGQRKRLALLISYLEDKPIYLFDEWAADQDPVFRRFFYHDLLFRLKESGKCVIAITHDDHYFHLADHVIKMSLGKITEEK